MKEIKQFEHIFKIKTINDLLVNELQLSCSIVSNQITQNTEPNTVEGA